MALSRRTGARFQASIWPGFVDAMTGLLLVLMFVLTIFMVVQFVLRETITGQESKLDALSAEVAALAQALGLEQDRAASLDERVGQLTATLGDARALQDQQAALIASLRSERDVQAGRIASFEEQVASLLAERDTALGTVTDLEGQNAALVSEQEALNLALANLRDEIDEQTEAARLAAARRDALTALVADLRQRNTASEQALSDEEAARLVEAAAAEALRQRLANADTELTAMTLALEEERRRAEETLALLAAAQTAGSDLNAQLAAALLAGEDASTTIAGLRTELAEANANRDVRAGELSEMETALTGAIAEANAKTAELDAATVQLRAAQDQIAQLLAQQQSVEDVTLSAQEVRAQLAAALAAKLAAERDAASELSKAEERAALLAQAQVALADQQQVASAAQEQQALLNQQVAALRQQLGQLQALLDDAKIREAATDVQLQSLGNELNTALARVAAEERRRAELEEEKRKLLEAEKQQLERYRSEFFGRVRDVLGTQEGVQIVGDRFVFSSEVLFAQGAADLSAEGQREIAKIANILRNVADDIPSEIDWVLQVDGHTDNVPIINGAAFADNWELSQARALSVVRFMVNFLGLPPSRLSANGFGEYQPINPANTPEARAQNRRIELKFTEK
ncbi:MAG: peptidoglycan -binding protein [Roseovarius sp.]